MIGKQILNYKITAQIGKGGMATVYEAIHIKLDTKVAIKVLDPILATNQTIYKRFVQEAKIMASLNHENITKVIDFDDQDKLAIVMEYLDGFTLNDYIKQKGALNKKEAITIFSKILEGFSYAHKKGIVHRDIKPSNIFITKGGKVKIMDFGIAKIIEDGANVLTQTGTQMGTPVYMSPEQVNDSKHINHLSDIYSLGVCLWFMLSGKPPYNAKTTSVFAIYKKIDAEPLAELPNTALNAIVKKATAKDKNKRFKSCDVLLNAISTKSSIDEGDEKTVIKDEKTIIEQPLNTERKAQQVKPKPSYNTSKETPTTNNQFKKMLYIVLGIILSGSVFFILNKTSNNGKNNTPNNVQENNNNTTNTKINTLNNGKNNTSNNVQENSINTTNTKINTVFVKGGTFTMGSGSGESDEKPKHKVTLSDFKISKYEITNAQYCEFLNEKGNQKEGDVYWLDIKSDYCQIMKKGYKFVPKAGKDKFPVIKVSCYGARAYCKWLGGRLPTEAEWEYAARGGAKSKGYKYAGSNTIAEVAWYSKNSDGKSHQVGTKKANELGIYDMTGNVWEWCSDWYSSGYYKNSPKENPKGAKNGTGRVFRGGGWYDIASDCRVAYRDEDYPTSTDSYLGFRPVFLP